MWKINNTRIYVTSYSETSKPVVAKLQPFGDKSIYHKFGRESKVYNLQGVIAGVSKKETLLALSYNTGYNVLTTPYTTISGLVCMNIEVNQLPVVYQTFDSDAACTDPVYEFRLELAKDEYA